MFKAAIYIDAGKTFDKAVQTFHFSTLSHFGFGPDLSKFATIQY